MADLAVLFELHPLKKFPRSIRRMTERAIQGAPVDFGNVRLEMALMIEAQGIDLTEVSCPVLKLGMVCKRLKHIGSPALGSFRGKDPEPPAGAIGERRFGQFPANQSRQRHLLAVTVAFQAMPVGRSRHGALALVLGMARGTRHVERHIGLMVRVTGVAFLAGLVDLFHLLEILRPQTRRFMACLAILREMRVLGRQGT